MPSFVISEKCDGCKGGDKTACIYICPNDLMVLDPDEMKAYNQEPDQCWECFSCVKICPTQAIEVRGYADFVPLGSSVMPMLGTEDVMWTCKFRNGLIKRFKFPNWYSYDVVSVQHGEPHQEINSRQRLTAKSFLG